MVRTPICVDTDGLTMVNDKAYDDHDEDDGDDDDDDDDVWQLRCHDHDKDNDNGSDSNADDDDACVGFFSKPVQLRQFRLAAVRNRPSYCRDPIRTSLYTF